MKKKIDRGHARLSPSASARWIACPGSIAFVESLKLPDWSSHAAELGTATHTLLEMALNGRCSPHKFLGRKIDSFKVDKYMANSADAGVDAIAPYLRAAVASGVEDQLDIASTGEWGTIDAWALMEYDIEGFFLKVWDFKNGRHPVPATKNSQMRLYAEAVFDHTMKHHGGVNIPWHLSIVQPNAFQGLDDATDTWKTDTKTEARWRAEYVAPAVTAIHDGTAKRIPGDHCNNCRGAGRCPELAGASMRAARMDWGVG